MDLKNLFETDGDERAVSPVIGVILMVAITVILAAVIGAFVIGIGEDQEVQPTASFNFDFEGNEVDISHTAGDTIEDPDKVFVNVDGDDAEWSDGDDTDLDGSGDYTLTDGGSYPVSGGSQVTIEASGGWDGETVSVIWESESGDSSATLSDTQAPTA